MAVLRKSCITIAKLDDNHIQQVATYNYTDDEPMRQYFVCVFENSGVWNGKKQEFLINVAVEQYKFDLDVAEVRSVFESCLKHKTDALMEWIVPFHKCLAASKVGDRAKKAADEAKKFGIL